MWWERDLIQFEQLIDLLKNEDMSSNFPLAHLLKHKKTLIIDVNCLYLYEILSSSTKWHVSKFQEKSLSDTLSFLGKGHLLKISFIMNTINSKKFHKTMTLHRIIKMNSLKFYLLQCDAFILLLFLIFTTVDAVIYQYYVHIFRFHFDLFNIFCLTHEQKYARIHLNSRDVNSFCKFFYSIIL